MSVTPAFAAAARLAAMYGSWLLLVQLAELRLHGRGRRRSANARLAVAAARRLQGDVEALEHDLARDRPREVEPLAHRPRGGEQLVGLGEVERGDMQAP